MSQAERGYEACTDEVAAAAARNPAFNKRLGYALASPLEHALLEQRREEENKAATRACELKLKTKMEICRETDFAAPP